MEQLKKNIYNTLLFILVIKLQISASQTEYLSNRYFAYVFVSSLLASLLMISLNKNNSTKK